MASVKRRDIEIKELVDGYYRAADSALADRLGFPRPADTRNEAILDLKRREVRLRSNISR